jgi:tRNA(Leu) C34 or U34 (ribose-2'-O)-methylase TrmL
MKTEFVCVGLTNPKSTSNVGSVMRAAGCYDVDEVLYTGRRYDRAAKLTTDTKKVRIDIPLDNIESRGLNCLTQAFDKDTKIVCVDLVKGATPLPAFKHPEKALYIFGPEDNTISQDVIDKADHVVFVPTIGCMNLAASVNVLLYDRLAKSEKAQAGDELILKSRDRNNNVKVKNK